MSNNASIQNVLGLDLGTNSVGWAIVQYHDGKPKAIEAAGVRIFSSGTKEGTHERIQSGVEESPAKKRREMRLQRRQAERRARRRRKIARILQKHGLLPQGNVYDDCTRDAMLKSLDREIYAKYHDTNKSDATSLGQLPYFLRARALDKPLMAYELGRALYHLGQRRGFLSNRLAPSKDEKEGEVKKNIAELYENMQTTSARTLGEYFAHLNPHETRIRNRWTARQMYLDEFEAIWKAQTPHFAQLKDMEFKTELHHALFFQRPMKTQKHLIGSCELEPDHKRAPWACLEAQRFRYLQKVNDLSLISAEGIRRALTIEERQILLKELDQNSELRFTTARKLIKAPKGSVLSHEEGGEEKLLGNRTAAALLHFFGDRWDRFTPEDKRQIVEDLLSIHNTQALERRAKKAWGLNGDDARQFASLRLEPDYCRLSRKALKRLLPLMETGMAFATAKKELYGEERTMLVLDALPILDDSGLEVRNPVVQRTLTEMRRVVNAIIDEYGKPDIIRIELARDLKKPKTERKRIWLKSRKNEKQRIDAAKRITDEIGNPYPKRDDILKVILAEECHWHCPYTNKDIKMQTLVGDAAQFDIEHIIPYSRCLDNSFMNKTLCYHEENRRKGNRTPWETYGSTPEWEEIIERVKKFDVSGRIPKLERFQARDLESFEEFSNRQLNDTRYASTLAANLLGLLYGGQVDANGRRRIQAGRGQVTSELRNAWHLNKILGDGGKKSRDDHRHHAIDAVAIALTDSTTVAMLSRAAAKAKNAGRRAWWKEIKEPWTGFLDDVAGISEKIIVSHKVSRKVNGPLHEETYYSPARLGPDGKRVRHVRKPVFSLSKPEMSAIVDDVVRTRVQEAFDRAGGDIKKLESKDFQPFMTTRRGRRRIPIKSVRIRKTVNARKLGKGHRERHAPAGSNHHMEIIEVTDRKGNVKWDDDIVCRLDAMRRKARHQPIIKRDHGPGKTFVMSLAPGEIIELDQEDGTRGLYVVRSISKDLVEFASITDARNQQIIKKAKQWGKHRLNYLRRAKCQKVVIDPLGRVQNAND